MDKKIIFFVLFTLTIISWIIFYTFSYQAKIAAISCESNGEGCLGVGLGNVITGVLILLISGLFSIITVITTIIVIIKRNKKIELLEIRRKSGSSRYCLIYSSRPKWFEHIIVTNSKSDRNKHKCTINLQQSYNNQQKVIFFS